MSVICWFDPKVGSQVRELEMWDNLLLKGNSMTLHLNCSFLLIKLSVIRSVIKEYLELRY